MERRNGKMYIKGTNLLVRYYQYVFEDGWDICCMTLRPREIIEYEVEHGMLVQQRFLREF